MTKEIFDKAASTWDEKPLRLQLAAAVANAIIKTIPVHNTFKALEIGCGTGLITTEISPLVKSILATDTSDGMLAVLNEKISAQDLRNVTTQCLDLTSESHGLPDTSFELIYSSMTFHHIKQTEKILHVCRELLSVGGKLCIADLDEEDGSFHGDMAGVEHYGFSKKKLTVLLTKCGFDKITYSTAHVISKETNGIKRDYPVFLMVAE